MALMSKNTCTGGGNLFVIVLIIIIIIIIIVFFLIGPQGLGASGSPSFGRWTSLTPAFSFAFLFLLLDFLRGESSLNVAAVGVGVDVLIYRKDNLCTHSDDVECLLKPLPVWNTPHIGVECNKYFVDGTEQYFHPGFWSNGPSS